MTLESPPAQHRPPEHSERLPVPPPVRHRHPVLRVIETVGFVILLIVALWFGYQWLVHRNAASAAAAGKGSHAGHTPPAPVTVVRVYRGDMPINLTGLLGLVTPLNTVTVHTRVDGQIMQVAYKEGQEVKAGQLLVQIDPRPYQVQLDQAEGTLAKDQAALEDAKADLERYQAAAQAVSQQQLDSAKAAVDSDAGVIKTDQAAIASAQLQLTYCKVTAPIAGRIGLRQVDEGNIVHATDTTGLAVITQLQPISVEFPVAENELQQLLKATGGSTNPTKVVPATALNGDDTAVLAQGKILAIDSQIDPTSGMIKVKALFQNEHEALFPSQFVNIRVLVNTLKNVTLVDSDAVQLGPQGAFVWRVGPDNKVMPISIETGPTANSIEVITGGVKPGDIVVSAGVDRLEAGAEVIPHAPVTEPTAGAVTQPTGSATQTGGASTAPAAGNRRGHRSAS